MTFPSGLDAFTNPRSVAVVGASSDPAKMGGAALRNLRHFGYPGRIYPVNARTAVSGGDGHLADGPVWRSLQECPERPDLVVVCVPADAALDVVTDAVGLRVPGLVLVSAGFGELAAGPPGQHRAARLRMLLDGSATRILGPNTAGLADFSNCCVPRAVLNSPDDVRPGPIAVVTQSGALSNTLLARLHSRDLGIGLVVATGDEEDLRVDHWLHHVADRPDLRTVVCVLESVRDGNALRSAFAALTRTGTTLVLLHVGGSREGAVVASTHTGALAADGDVLRAIAQANGGVWATGIEDACRLAVLSSLSGPPLPDGGHALGPPRTFLLCGSGGEAALLTDQYVRAGVPLPPPGKNFENFVRSAFSFAHAANPFDLTGEVLSDPRLLSRTLEAALAEDVDLVHVALPVFRDELGDRLYTGVPEVLAASDRPVLATLWTGRGMTERSWALWSSTRAVVLGESDGVPAALARLRGALDGRVSERRSDAGATHGSPADLADGLPALADRLKAGLTIRTEDGRVLGDAVGLRAPDTWAAEDFLSEPRPGTYFLKGYRSHVLHKRRHGLVRGPASAAAAADLARTAIRDDPATTWTVERAVPRGVPLLVSWRFDAGFGWALLAGAGGDLAELLTDVVVTITPAHSAVGITQAVERSQLRRYVTAQMPEAGQSQVDAVLHRLIDVLQKFADAAPTLKRTFDVVEFNPVLIDSCTPDGSTPDAWFVDFVATQHHNNEERD